MALLASALPGGFSAADVGAKPELTLGPPRELVVAAAAAGPPGADVVLLLL